MKNMHKCLLICKILFLRAQNYGLTVIPVLICINLFVQLENKDYFSKNQLYFLLNLFTFFKLRAEITFSVLYCLMQLIKLY